MATTVTLENRGVARPVRKVRVRVVGAPQADAVLAEDEAVVVGSAPDASLVLPDPTASRYHVEIHRAATGIHVTDLGSTNGTFVGDVGIGSAVVRPGTRIRVGRTELLLEDGAELAEPAEMPDGSAIDEIVGDSRAIRAVKRNIALLAPSAISVLVEGETGTGKELIARALHDHGPRAGGPFVTVDCASLPATMIASELFGHERGAFTGADRQRAGAFEEADRGTLFLDEIGELPLSVQPVLLGALERRRFRRLGGGREIEVDVRVVTATNRDLRREVNAGTFRPDLFYRMAVGRIMVPSLRERPEDVPHLVRHFVKVAQGALEPFPFSEGAMEMLAQHPWSGNVRELRNVVERALAMGQLTLTSEESAAAAPAVAEEAPPLLPYRDARQAVLDRFERDYLSALIERAGGNASEAARIARMDRSHLVDLLRKHGLR